MCGGNQPSGVRDNGNNNTDPDKQGVGPGSTRGGDRDPANQAAKQARADAISKASAQNNISQKQTNLSTLTRNLGNYFRDVSTPKAPTTQTKPSQALEDKLKQSYTNYADSRLQGIATQAKRDAALAAQMRSERLADQLTKNVTPAKEVDIRAAVQQYNVEKEQARVQQEYQDRFGENPRNITDLTKPPTDQPDLDLVDLAHLTKLRGADINDIVTPSVARSILNNNTPALQRDEMQPAYDKLNSEQTKIAAILSNQITVQGGSLKTALGVIAMESRFGIDPNTYKQDSYVGPGQIGKVEFAKNASAAAKALGIYDPYANIQASVSYINDTTTRLNKAGIENPTEGQIYGAYNQGVKGYTNLKANPSMKAADVVGLEHVKQNLPTSMKARAGTMTAAEFSKVIESYPANSYKGITGQSLDQLPDRPSAQPSKLPDTVAQAKKQISGTVQTQQPTTVRQQTSLDNPESQNVPSPAQVKDYLEARGWPAEKPINGQYGYRLSNTIARAETAMGVKAPRDYFSSTYRTPQEQAQIKANSLGKNYTFDGVTYKPDWSLPQTGTNFQAAEPSKSAHQKGMAADTINESVYGPEASAAAMAINDYIQKNVPRAGQPDVNNTGIERINPEKDPNHIQLSGYKSKTNAGGIGKSAMLDSSIGATTNTTVADTVQIASTKPSTVQSLADKLKVIAGITPSTQVPATPVKKGQTWSEWAAEKMEFTRKTARDIAIAQYKKDHPILGGFLDKIGYFNEKKTTTKPQSNTDGTGDNGSFFPTYNSSSTRSN